MTDKQYDRWKQIQQIATDILAIYSILDTIFGWNTIAIVLKLFPISISLIGHILGYESTQYFSTKSIVTKIVPDTTEDAGATQTEE